jgi:hypothetical protein
MPSLIDISLIDLTPAELRRVRRTLARRGRTLAELVDRLPVATRWHLFVLAVNLGMVGV